MTAQDSAIAAPRPEASPAGVVLRGRGGVSEWFDRRSRQIPVRVEGRVLPAVTVSPASLFVGAVQPGKQVTRQLVVRGKKPFRIVSITCEDGSLKLQASVDDTLKPLHLIPVTFLADGQPGKVVKTIRIETDLDDATAKLAAYAVVLPP